MKRIGYTVREERIEMREVNFEFVKKYWYVGRRNGGGLFLVGGGHTITHNIYMLRPVLAGLVCYLRDIVGISLDVSWVSFEYGFLYDM